MRATMNDEQMHRVCGVVLAAGRSTRTDGEYKLTSLIGGKPMVWFPVRHLRDAGVTRVIAVVGHERKKVWRNSI